MSQTLATPPPSDLFRRTFIRWWNDPDTRSVLIGLAGMLLVHLILLLIAPHLQSPMVHLASHPHPSARQFNIEIAPNAFIQKPKPPPPKQFVETNPNAPDNVPDKTNNFAAQNQQVAQEKPTPNGKSERPAMEGQKEIHSTQIVSGLLSKPREQLDAAPPEPVQPQPPATVPKLAQTPLSGTEKVEGKDDSAYGSNIAKFAPDAKAIPEKVDGAKNVPLIQGATGLAPAIDPKHPRPRQMIVKQQQVRPAIFEENKFGTSNTGIIGISAQFSNYGAYLQRMCDAIQMEFDRINEDSSTRPVSGTHTIVKFRMNDKGGIAQIVSVEGTTGNQGEKICVSSITNRAPFGEWTDDMKAMLGDSQELTFEFYYQ